MILICPSCGATHSAEAWENDVLIRQSMQTKHALPPEVGKVCLGYLSLFRPPQRALSWRKSLKILSELSALIAPGYVQVQGSAARKCPPSLWAMGMERMMEQAATLTRPMKNHNYLRQIVWQLADQADARGEQQVRQAEQTGSTKAHRTADDEMSPAMRRYIKEHGDPLGHEESAARFQTMIKKMKDRQGEINASE